jgi:TonB family protein
MRRILLVLVVLTGYALAQDRSAPAKYAREAFDTAQEILKTRPMNLDALVATITQVTDITPTPADLDAAEKAADLLLYSQDTIFAAATKPRSMSDEDWLKAKVQVQVQVKSLAEWALIAIDALRKDPEHPPQKPRPQKAEPKYSEEALLAGLEGRVLVMGTVAGDGSVQNLRVSRGLGLGLDEQALATVAQLRVQPGSPLSNSAGPVTLPIDFTLPSKHSHWHLIGAEFAAPSGVSRPTFERADYPSGPGIGSAAWDAARLVAANGGAATATVSFDVDASGFPGHFHVVRASEEVWGPEAITLVQGWRFHPGTRAGMPVSVPCTVNLIWGSVDFVSALDAAQASR